MEGVKKKYFFLRIYCRRGYLSRANFYKFCLASAKAQKSHPAKISSIKVHKFTREKQVLYERTIFRKSHLVAFIYVGAYEQIRRSSFLRLPHRTTLNKYTGFTKIGTGFDPDIIKHVYDDVKLEELKEFEKHIILLFDEMKIKSGLVYSKSSYGVGRYK